MNVLLWCFLLMFFFKDYLDSRKLRLWDFFRNIDKDGTMRVPVTDFRKAVQVCKQTDNDDLSKVLQKTHQKGSLLVTDCDQIVQSSHVKRQFETYFLVLCLCMKRLAINHSFESIPDWGADSEAGSWRDRNSGLQVNISLTVWSYTQIYLQNRLIVGTYKETMFLQSLVLQVLEDNLCKFTEN